MPGQLVIDARQTFASAIIMDAGPKIAFGSVGEHAHNKQGTPQWQCAVAVTYLDHEQRGGRPVSEVINVTITAPSDPFGGLMPGTQVEFDRLMLGVSTPERTDRGVRGGKPFYSAMGVRALVLASNGRKDQ